jgi:hypothetical protein
MAQDNAERSPIGRTALGGAACGFSYDAALADAVAREERLRRPLRLARWQDAARRVPGPPVGSDREPTETAAGPDRLA